MAETPSRRFGLHAPSGGDPAQIPADVKRLRDQLDDVMLGYDQGPLASRPAAGVEGRMYYATDVASLFYDTSTTWVPFAWQPGDVRWQAYAQTIDGWLWCNGDAVSRATYRALFDRIGTVWGRGDGSTTFNVPDLRGRTIIGGGLGYLFGAVGGSATHRLTEAELPRHFHAYQNVNTLKIAQTAGGATDYGVVTSLGRNNSEYAGGDQPHNNMPPYLAMHAYIKV